MMRSRIAFLALSVFTAAAFANDRVRIEETLPFDPMADAVCFRNGDADLAKTRIPILGRLAVKKGVCQGIAGISVAFRENVEFAPAEPAERPAAIARKLKAAVRANRRRTGAKIRFRGYASLTELCRANRMAFLKKAVWLNTPITLEDILPVYGQFRELKREPISASAHPEALRRQLAETLAGVRAGLRAGRYPLLLYFSHVVLVRGYRELETPAGPRRIELSVHDSNHPGELRSLTFSLAADGLPGPENRMVWLLRPGGDGDL